jgi:outer membrane protein assembly factor BamB
MMGGSSARDGRAGASVAPSGPSLEWTISATDYPSACAVATDGSVFFTDGMGLHALGRDGAAKWTVPCSAAGDGPAQTSHRSSPAIGPDGTIYVGCLEDLVAVRPEGTERWRSHGHAVIPGSPALGADGTVYVAADDDQLHAFDAGGRLLWSAPLGTTGTPSSPAVGPSGTIYVLDGVDVIDRGYGIHLYATSRDGTSAWQTKLPAFDSSGTSPPLPAVAADDTVYVSDYTSSVVAIAADGTEKWEGKGPEFAGLAIGADSTVYAWGSTFAKGLVALRPDGSTLWSTGPGADGWGFPPAIGHDGTIYVFDQGIHSFRDDGTPIGSLNYGNGYTDAPAAIGADGTIYVAVQGSGFEIRAIRPPG